jgi:2-polyprenyl-3-methyl-5-hydroxy-6-metoxy-1,4-benzoquinol methylase
MMGARLRQSHQADPESYARDCKSSLAFFKHNYLRHMPPNRQAQILEIGVGLGQFQLFCREYGYTNTQGIDLDDNNVAFCREKEFAVKHADALEYLAACKEPLDAVIMNDVIEHIPKDKVIPLMTAIRTSLKPTGVYILKTINMANPIMGTHSRYNDFTHETGWTEESMREALEHAGFEQVTVLPSNLYVFYRNPLNYIAMAVAKVFEIFFYAYFVLHGRTTTHVFTKNLLAVAFPAKKG